MVAQSSQALNEAMVLPLRPLTNEATRASMMDPIFNEPKFDGSMRFNEPKLDGSMRFNKPKLDGSMRFNGPKFDGSMRFNEPKLDGSMRFNEQKMDGSMMFNEPKLDGSMRLDGPKFDGSNGFNGPNFDGSKVFIEDSLMMPSVQMINEDVQLGPTKRQVNIIFNDIDFSKAFDTTITQTNVRMTV